MNDLRCAAAHSRFPQEAEARREDADERRKTTINIHPTTIHFMKTLIKNARIISPGIDMPGAAVEMEGKTITAVYPAGSELPAADKVVDAEGRMLLPGFIDIHSHGAGGCDTCDAKLESLRTIAECK